MYFRSLGCPESHILLQPFGRIARPKWQIFRQTHDVV